MRRRFQVAPIAILVAFFCTAVPADAASYVIGAKGGVAWTNLDFRGPFDPEPRAVFDGGAFFGADYLPNFGMRLEGLYSPRGAEGSIVIPGSDHSHDSVWSLDDLVFPVLFIGRMPIGTRHTFGAFAGPSFAFNLKSEIDVRHGEVHEVEDLEGISEPFEFGIVLGLETTHRVGSIELVTDLRLTNGLTNRVDVLDAQVKTRDIALHAGVQYRLGTH
jgi:hypothetical protein